MLNDTEANIFITNDHTAKISEIISAKNYTNVIVIVDENTRQHCLPLLGNIFHKEPIIIEIPSGEENKTLTTCSIIWQQMTDHQLDRKAVVINLGGGVIGDMGGFCASTYKRGIDFIQVPTTLLSQVDASVGGKLGIDFEQFKNHIGVFRVPNAVVINSTFLDTLSKRELRSGYAEVIKHALIADKSKWEDLKTKTLANQNWTDIAVHSVKIKSKIAKEDPFEAGLRKILNFGHTIGHAVESYYLMDTTKKLLHGEAIAVGMIAEAFVSVKKGFISQAECDDIKSYIISIYDHPQVNSNDYEQIIGLTLQDKKNKGGEVLASLLEEIGIANYDISLNAEDITDGLNYYNS